MIEPTPLTIELQIGYRDKQASVHKRVTFGNRLLGKTLFNLDDNPQSRIATQYGNLVMRSCITEFGSLRMPVPLSALLELDSIDGDVLAEGFDTFLNQCLGDHKVEFLTDEQVKLALGYESHGLQYDIVSFGTHLTGMHEVEADRLKLADTRRKCFLAGKQVVRLSQSEGASVLDGPIGLNIFEALDSIDLHAICTASEVWRNSFRRIQQRVQEVGDGSKRVPPKS